MAVFEHPANGHRESVGWSNAALTAAFGVIYLAFRGLWGFALLWILGVSTATFAMMGLLSLCLPAVQIATLGALGSDYLIGMLLVLMTIPHLLFSLLVPRMLRQKYLRSGWRRVP